jgi:hypothetical protein
VKILAGKGSEIQWGGDFGNTDETLLTQDYDRPVMVDRYPSEIKAFYFQPDELRPEVALGVDVIAPEGYGEIIGGGQRIHDLGLLEARLDQHQLPREAFNCASAPFPMVASAWAWNASSPGCAAWNTSAKPSLTRACSIAPVRSLEKLRSYSGSCPISFPFFCGFIVLSFT